MTDPFQKIRDEMYAAVALQYPKGVPATLQAKIDEEFALASSIDAIDGKGKAINTLHSIWKSALSGKTKYKSGHSNKSNSWIAYAIGLTDKMPDGATLPERRAFARASYPDIDSDFEDERREEVVAHIKKVHGADRVANVGTHGTMHMKSTVRSLSKVHDCGGGFLKGKDQYKTLNRLKADEIINSLPEPQGNKIVWTDDDGKQHEIKTVKDAYEWVPSFRAYMDKYPMILKDAENIEGLSSNFSTHASGIIIANAPLSELAPVRPVVKKNWLGEAVESWSTQFAYEDCETIGLIKFDILAIKMLSIIKHALRLIRENYDINLDIENLPLDDKATFDLYKSGNLTGCFQTEGYGMQKTCREIAPDRFEDIVVAIALYRPGPMANIAEYVARKNGTKKVDYYHPTIEPHVKDILEPTYGVLCYQEQVMMICNRLAGFSLSDAYQIIKAVGKKKMDLMQLYGDQFIRGCMAKGVPEEVARQYWGGIDAGGNLHGFIVPFANYGFNKSHSLCYGYNSYTTALLKANYCEEYMCASLNVEAMRKKWNKVRILENDCDRKNNIKITPRYDPKTKDSGINYCGLEYVIKSHGKRHGNPGEITPPLLCQGLSYAAAEEIVRARGDKRFKDIRDFATRTRSEVDTNSVACLAEAGFFARGKGEAIVAEFEAIRNDLKKARKKGLPSGDMFEDEET